MAILIEVRTIHKQENREFSCYVEELETGFEFLNHIVRDGSILLQATLIEKDRRMALPVEAFEGSSFSPVLEQLKREWTASLASPRVSD